MNPSRTRARSAIIGVVALASLAAIPAADAFTGDWNINGSFERTTTPSFAGGFNPNDLDSLDATFDNRAKRLSLRLTNFETPSRGTIYASLGTGLTDGTCSTGSLDITITTNDATITHDVTTTERYWATAESYRSRSGTNPGPGWTYIGYSYSDREYLWYKPAGWAYRTETHSVTETDPNHYQRIATLERDGIDSNLQTTTLVDTNTTNTTWTFASPLLNAITADCIEVTVPNRRAPYVIAPPATPTPPTPPPPPTTPPTTPPRTPPTDPGTSTDDDITLDDITATATRRGTKIALTINGDADQIGIRIKKTSKTISFRPNVLLKNQAATTRYISVRFSDGSDWSDWERIPVR